MRKKKRCDNCFLLTLYIFFLILLLLGVLINSHVVIINGGKMPVKTTNPNLKGVGFEKEFIIFQNNNEVKFWFLADIIKIGSAYISIGDIFCFCAFALFLYIQFYYLKTHTFFIRLIRQLKKPNFSNTTYQPTYKKIHFNLAFIL